MTMMQRAPEQGNNHAHDDAQRRRIARDELEAELVDLETAVEWLERRHSEHLWILAMLIQRLWGKPPYPDPIVQHAYRTLYPNVDSVLDDGYELRSADGMPWRRPERRYSAYGRLSAVRRAAERAGLRPAQRWTRQWMIWMLWDAGKTHREILQLAADEAASS